MSATLDGQNLFDEQDLKIELGSVGRDSIELTVPGLDGVLSIDMGERGRKIKQKGVLRAKSRAQMDDRICAIQAYIDGDTHTLVISNGEEFNNVRMDAFRVTEEKTSGSGLCCDYEIVYTQLVV
ncbi:MAG: hypothetical protein ABSG99_07295 [Sedimentisphaerales bacterium]